MLWDSLTKVKEDIFNSRPKRHEIMIIWFRTKLVAGSKRPIKRCVHLQITVELFVSLLPNSAFLHAVSLAYNLITDTFSNIFLQIKPCRKHDVI